MLCLNKKGKVTDMNLQEGLLGYLFYNVFDKNAGDMRFLLLQIGAALLTMVIAYLLGSINSAILTSKVLFGDDVRRHGSGNAGLTNMLRTYGKRAAVFTLLGDLLKTALAIFIAGVIGGFGYVGGIAVGFTQVIPMVYLAALFSVLGHIFPIYYKFRGGKGVLCTAVAALILNPIEFAILIVIWILMVALTKYVSLASVTVAILYPIVVHGHFSIAFGGQEHGILALVTILLAIIIVYCHRENLKRISEGTERKISIGKPPKGDGDDK